MSSGHCMEGEERIPVAKKSAVMESIEAGPDEALRPNSREPATLYFGPPLNISPGRS